MNRLLMALSLYIGLGFFFAVNALSILSGATMLTAMSRGVVALATFALLGTIAGMVARVKPAVSEVRHDSPEPSASPKA